MGKRQPPLVYKGSLQTFFWGYITKYHMFANPKDFHAWNYCNMANSVKTGKQKFPGLLSELQVRMFLIDGKDNHSHVIVKWSSNMEKKFFIHQGSDSVQSLYERIRYYNQVCEDDRNWDNQDDEPEDETLLLT